MITVRSATASDAAAIEGLRSAMTTELAERRGGPQLLATAPTSPAQQLVGCIDDAVVGLAELAVAGEWASLQVLYVLDAVRGVGVGHGLLEAAIAAARQAGAKHLDSMALPGDRDTKNFFESHAMKSRLLVVHQEL